MDMAITFREGPVEGVLVEPLKRFPDARGWLIEMYRVDELAPSHGPAMGYVSETLPGVSRGPHEHVDQTDVFLFLGPGEFRVQVWDNRPSSPTYRNRTSIVAGADRPLRVIVPPGVVHGYRNISAAPAIVYNFPNRLYKGPRRAEPVDEIRHEADPNSPYVMDEA
jgi:dTDP-4-dehydrorhamnose 3,5-epimerase